MNVPRSYHSTWYILWATRKSHRMNESGPSTTEAGASGAKSPRPERAPFPTVSCLWLSYHPLSPLPPWASQACQAHRHSCSALETADLSPSPNHVFPSYSHAWEVACICETRGGGKSNFICQVNRTIIQPLVNFSHVFQTFFVLKDLYLSALMSNLSKTINDRS